MNFEDKISLKVKVYSDGYVESGNKFYMADENGEPVSSLECEFYKKRYDDDGNPVTTINDYWFSYGKCLILPNTRANSIVLNDGNKYTYDYEVYLPLNKKKYAFLPKEGCCVKIEKKDGTINSEKEVRGFTTYRKRYLRLWL